jgi:hypothetical protein
MTDLLGFIDDDAQSDEGSDRDAEEAQSETCRVNEGHRKDGALNPSSPAGSPEDSLRSSVDAAANADLSTRSSGICSASPNETKPGASVAYGNSGMPESLNTRHAVGQGSLSGVAPDPTAPAPESTGVEPRQNRLDKELAALSKGEDVHQVRAMLKWCHIAMAS